MEELFRKRTEKTIEILKNNQSKNSFCFVLMSDTMLSDLTDDTVKYISHFDSILNFDAIIHLGNFLIGGVPRQISMELLNEETEKFRNSIASKKMFLTQGNHDGYRDESFPGQLTTDIMYDELWYKSTLFLDEYNNLHRDKFSPYYYYDIPDKKIRLIFLCSYYSQIDEENGFYEKYTSIDVKQKVWLKNTALNVEKGVTVLLFSHRIPKSCFENGENPFIYKGRYTDSFFRTLQIKKELGINIVGWFCGAYGNFEVNNPGGIDFISVKNYLSSNITYDKRGESGLPDLGFNIITLTPEKRKINIISSFGTDGIDVRY